MSVLVHSFLHDGWLDFLHIGCLDQLPLATDVCKIEFGSVPNMSNYSKFFKYFECLLWYLGEECCYFVHIWYSYLVPCVAHACKIWLIMATFSTFCVFVVISLAIITQIWHRVKCNFTRISSAWYLITLPNVNKIIKFFLEISQQKLKIYEKK